MDIEYELLFNLITENSNIKKVYGKVTPEMFTGEVNRVVFTEIIRNYDVSGKILTIAEICQKLDSKYDKDVIANWMANITKYTSLMTTNIESSVKVITNDWKARKVKEIVEKSPIKADGIESTINNLLSEFEALKDNKSRMSHSLSDIAKQNKANYFKEHEEGIKTGLSTIDDYIVGLEKGDVMVIGARPSVGKSAFATQMITTVARTGKRVGYFNLEMSDAQIYERIVSSFSGIRLMRIRRAIKFLGEEQEKFDKANKEIEKLDNLEIFSGSYSASEIKHLCRNQDFDLVVIDYLQIVKPDKNYGNRVAEVGEISKTIKSLAMELKVPVVALSQLNRKKTATDEPEINDLRESGDIEQDASTIMFLWNIDELGQYKGLSVVKNRQGTLGKMALQFDGSHMSFIPSTDDLETLTKAVGGFKSAYNFETPF